MNTTQRQLTREEINALKEKLGGFKVWRKTERNNYATRARELRLEQREIARELKSNERELRGIIKGIARDEQRALTRLRVLRGRLQAL